MTTFQNKTFTNENIVVDDNIYETCRFVNCTLVYQGGKTPVFNNCTFSGLRIQLEGGASQTVKYLSGLYQGGLSSTVERVLTKIERGELASPAPAKPVFVPSENLGANYGRLALISGVMLLITVLLVLSFWYGLVYQPQNDILNGEEAQPLVWEIPQELMPVLPDDLAQVYDASRDNQIQQISTYRWVNEGAGTVSVPIETAITLLLENQ